MTPTRNRKHSALVVDDDPAILAELRAVCTALGHEVHTATTVEETLALLEQRRFCYLLLDMFLPPAAGLAPYARAALGVLAEIRSKRGLTHEQLPVVVITGRGDEDLVRDCFKAGTSDYARKPFSEAGGEPLDKKIRDALAFACERRRACPHQEGDVAASTGRTYTTRHRLHFMGGLQKGRALLHVNRVPVWVQRNTFEVLWRLWVADGKSSDGWIHGSKVVPIANFSLTLGNAIKDLKRLAKVDDLIERDGKGLYRFCTSPDLVTHDEGAMREHYLTLLRLCA